MPSNHTRIGAWVNSKMSGKNLLVYCTIPLIAICKDITQTQKTREAWVTAQSVILHLGSDGCQCRGFISIDDVDVILESCLITIVIRI